VKKGEATVALHDQAGGLIHREGDFTIETKGKGSEQADLTSRPHGLDRHTRHLSIT
jgi:hypothetical protein